MTTPNVVPSPGISAHPVVVPPSKAELAENATYAGELVATVRIGLDITDDPVRTTHDLARLLLSMSPADL